MEDTGTPASSPPARDQRRGVVAYGPWGRAPSTAVRPGEPTAPRQGTTSARDTSLARFFALSSELLCIATFDGWLVEVSPSWSRTLGWTDEELCSRPYLDLVHPDDVEATISAASGLIDGRSMIGFENRYLHADGTYRWLRWHSVPDLEQQQIVAVVQDVTESRRRQALSEQLEHVTGVGTWELDLATNRTRWSAVTHAVHGTDPLSFDASVDDALSFYPPPGRTLLRDALDRLVAVGDPYDLALPFTTLHGASRWVRATGRATVRDGKVTRVYGTFQDITEQHEEREHLRHFHDLIELSEEGILELDPQGQVLFANSCLAAMLGQSSGSLAGRHVLSLVDGRDADGVRSWLLELGPQAPTVTRGELRLVARDGSRCWVKVSARAHRDDGGALHCITAVLTDISTHKEREAELQEARAQLEEAQHIAQLGHWQATIPAEELRWSPVVFDIFGRDPSTFRPTIDAFYASIHPEDLPLIDLSEAEGARTGSHDVCVRIVRPDGALRHVRLMARSETDADGQVVRIRGTVQDVTDVRLAERALRDSEQLLQRVLTATHDGWWDSDLVAGRAYHSDRWWELHGYQPGALPTHVDLWRSLIHPEDLPRVEAMLDRVIEAQLPTFEVSGRALHRDGSGVPVVVRGLIDYDEAGRPVRLSGATTDVTRVKQAERIQEEFVSTVSHELRTPLTSIGGALDLIEAGVAGPIDAPMATLVAVAQRNTRRLRLLIDDLLDMERLLSGRTRIRLVEQPLEPLISRALEDNATYASSHGVRYELEPGLQGAVVAVDADRLQQVLANYLSNAAKFAPEGSQVSVRMRASDGCVRTEVIDRGPGVPEEVGDRVFDRFVQADPTDQRSRGGTGLGLAISREIIERLGGQVGFDSEPGHTCFWFDLPTPD